MRRLEASTRLAGYADWPGLAQVCRIERTRIEKGKETTEVSYAITSLDRQRANAADLLAFNRGHWGIENRLHWVRDVTFGEDGCRMKTGDGPQNLATIRNAGLTAMRLAGHKGIASTLRDFAAKPLELLKMLRRFNK